MREGRKAKRGSPKLIWGAVLIALFYALLLVIPTQFFQKLLGEYRGRPLAWPGQLVIAALWFLCCYALIRLVFGLWHRISGNERRRLNLFGDIMSALDRLSSGDFDVLLEVDERGFHNELADKINQLAKQLSTTEQMRQEFISNVSHEMQSPLTSISGFAVLLKSETLSSEERLHYLGIIEAESKRLSKLSENLLKLSVLDAAEVELDRSTYRLDKQLEDILLMLEPQWSAKSLELDISLERVQIVADSDLLSQVWINLIHNSIKFTEDGGSIVLRLSESEGRVIVEIMDSGIGIPEESLVHLFERFYKVDKSRDRTLGGNGLGLSLVKRIVDMHEGRIAVKSEMGRGSCFKVELPLVDAETEAS